MSRFVLCRDERSDNKNSNAFGALDLDEDGDIIVTRRSKKKLTIVLQIGKAIFCTKLQFVFLK